VDYRTIVEAKRRMDFNLTEHETLVRLVGDAQDKGSEARRDIERLSRLSAKLAMELEQSNLIHDGKMLDNVKEKYTSGVGIDGSFQLVGGLGGIWYSPISVARIVFPKGPNSKPRVDIFWAGIEEIREQKEFNPETKASILMLTGESKAIQDWGINGKQAYVLIDGPIVDPPAYREMKYVKDRCNAIRKCMQKSSLAGCVKRSRDKFYIAFLEKETGFRKSELAAFPSDQHLMLFTFTHLRYHGWKGPIFTELIDLSKNDVYRSYRKNGVYVGCLFFQKSISSQVLRLDIPFLKPLRPRLAEKMILHAVKAVSEWTLPGQDYPVPIFLAHEKCNIREGCAEVLYDEIITRSTATDPENQTVLTLLR
jgi:hypothetical protein